MQIGKIANIFPKKNSLKNVPCVNIRNCLVVLELISSNWKEISTCADLYNTEIFFNGKRVINELTGTRHNCQSSRMHQYTHRQEINKKRVLSHARSHASPPNIKTCLNITVKNAGI